MSAFAHSGLWETQWFPKKASTTFVKKSFVELASGYVQPCTSSTAKILGVNQDSAYASSDATTVKIPVLVPKSMSARVRATQSAATTVGSEYDLTDDVSVNQGASTNDPLTCVASLSATEGLFAINQPQLA
jgi:hypothetical protein